MLNLEHMIMGLRCAQECDGQPLQEVRLESSLWSEG